MAKIELNLHLLKKSLNQKGKILEKYTDRWRLVVISESIEHLTIPRGVLIGWGIMILFLQTLAVLAPIEFFLQIAGLVWTLLFLLFRQYCRVWRRYYSLFWPLFIHLSALAAAILLKARIHDVHVL
jgi:hypothetical protein